MEKTFDEIMQEEQANLAAKQAEFKARGKELKLDPKGPGLVPQDIYDSEIRPHAEGNHD